MMRTASYPNTEVVLKDLGTGEDATLFAGLDGKILHHAEVKFGLRYRRQAGRHVDQLQADQHQGAHA